MATVLPFDPHARRRSTPARPTASVPAAPATRGERGERVVPLRVVRDDEAPAAAWPAVERRRPVEAHTDVRADVRVDVRAAIEPRTEAAPAETTDRELALRFFPLVLAVALADLSTKALALAALAEQAIPVVGPVSLSLAHNTVSAGAGWLGASTRGANVAATGVVLGVLMLLAPALHRLERRTTEALALMVGGGLGNLLSLATRETGVPDFLRVEHANGAWVLNLADLCMLAGLAWLTATLVQGLRAAPAGLPARARRLIPRPLAYRTLRPAPAPARRPAARAARRAALTVVRCAALVSVGATALLYAQRDRMVGVTTCVPGTPVVLSGANPFSRLAGSHRAETLAHEAVHAAQIRERGCLAVYRAQLFGSPEERVALEVDAACAELAASARGLPREGAEYALAHNVVTAYPSLRAVGFERALEITRARCTG